ncbi:MAG: cyclic nucleotide-binding domain-containing protein [Candidatus Hydrogenedentota bacterium]
MQFTSLHAAWEAIPLSLSLSERINTAWLDTLREVGTRVQVRSGDNVISLNDTNTGTGYVLYSGEISVQKKDAPEIVKPAPELLGEMGQLNPAGTRTASVVAATDVALISFNWTKLNAALAIRLSEAELETLKDAIQQYAWSHFVE